jgi:cell division protein FtsB
MPEFETLMAAMVVECQALDGLLGRYSEALADIRMRAVAQQHDLESTTRERNAYAQKLRELENGPD